MSAGQQSQFIRRAPWSRPSECAATSTAKREVVGSRPVSYTHLDASWEHGNARRVGLEERGGRCELFEFEAGRRLIQQVGERVGHRVERVERVAGDAAPGRDVDGDARGVPRQAADFPVDVAALDPVERVPARPARDRAGQDAGVLAGDDRVVCAVAEYGGVDFERLYGESFRFKGDRGPETGPLSDVSSMAYTLKAPRLTCRPCASRPRRPRHARTRPPSIALPRRCRPGRRARRRWARRSRRCARRSPRR